MKTVRQVGY